MRERGVEEIRMAGHFWVEALAAADRLTTSNFNSFISVDFQQH